MHSWWLSFADGSLPKGSQLLGVVIVDAHAFTEALTVATVLGLNPGGEVEGYRVPPAPAKYKNRLLTRAEAEEADNAMSSL